MHPRLQWISRPPRALQVVLGVGWIGLSGWFDLKLDRPAEGTP